MEEWEEAPVAPIILLKEPVRSKWDDEDADDDDVKESWEDEDEPAPAPTPAPTPTPVEKTTKKSSEKASDKKGKAAEKVSKPTQVEVVDPVAEKLRQQRLVEEADLKSTAELFGKKDGDDKNLETFIPKSESDFLEYAELISHKLRPYEKSFHYMGLLKAIMRLSTTALKGSEVKEVASSITTNANEKIKAEKEAAGGKKKAGKKKQLIVGKPDDDVAVGGDYDALDDYDFM